MNETNMKSFNNVTLERHGKYVKKRLNQEFQQGLADIKNESESVSSELNFIQEQLLAEEKKKQDIKKETELLNQRIAEKRKEKSELLNDIDRLEIKKQKKEILVKQIEKRNAYQRLKLIKKEPLFH